MTDVYIQLTYDEYKDMEKQLLSANNLEQTYGAPGFYHRAFRLRVGSITFEFQGPSVRTPKRDV